VLSKRLSFLGLEILFVRFWRKAIRRLNWYGIFVDTDNSREPVAVIAGYTRSGTTFLGRVLSNIVGARPIHEPLNPHNVPEVSFFKERESRAMVENNPKYRNALKAILSADFRGTRYTNTGSSLVYAGRIIKLVRANHYLDYVSSLIPDTPIIVIMRNPFSCIASRIHLGWPVPDHSNSIKDMIHLLSEEQLKAYKDSDSLVSQLAVSWCLDNFMLLRNVDHPNFMFVCYEDILVNPGVEMTRILSHIRRDNCVNRISFEMILENGDTEETDYLQKWKKALKPSDLDVIVSILKLFKLDGYYDFESGYPLGKFPFSASHSATLEAGPTTTHVRRDQSDVCQ
jgi:hypothetical protein